MRRGRLVIATFFVAAMVEALSLAGATPFAGAAVASSSDLQIVSATVTPNSAAIGGRVQTVITARNNGPDTAETAFLRVEVLGDTPLVASQFSVSAGSCVPDKKARQRIFCTLGSLSPGQQVTLRVNQIVDSTWRTDTVGITVCNVPSGTNDCVLALGPPCPQGPFPCDPMELNNKLSVPFTLLPGQSASPKGTPTGTVLVDGQPFTGGPIPYGSRVDVTNGRLLLTTREGSLLVYGGGVSAQFLLLRFKVRRKFVDELRLVGGDFTVCGRRSRTVSAVAKPPPRTSRRLFAKGKGSFRTRGRYSAATIRGTFWLTADRCDGTLTNTFQGVVSVRDLVRRVTVLVPAGKTYLARKR